MKMVLGLELNGRMFFKTRMVEGLDTMLTFPQIGQTGVGTWTNHRHKCFSTVFIFTGIT